MDNEIIQNRISQLREEMKKTKIDAYLIPSDDDHASEYVNDHFKCREWITGFNGSAGTALITADDAWLWTDGRYFLQAEEQLSGTGVTLMKMNEPDVPTIKEKICELAAAYNDAETDAADVSKSSRPFTLGFDGWTMTARDGEEFEKECPVRIVYSKDLIGRIWEDRPELEPSRIREFPITSCGKSSDRKLDAVRFEMDKRGADVLLISDLMEIAWLFNLRGSDIQNTPVFYAYAIVTIEQSYLFVLPGVLNPWMKGKLIQQDISFKKYDKVSDVLASLTSRGGILWADKSKTPYYLIKNVERCQRKTTHLVDLYNDVADQIEEIPRAADYDNSVSDSLIDEPTPIEIMKAVKNETEIAATEHAHLKDGVAVTEFIYWLKQKAAELAETGQVVPEDPGVTADGRLTEISCCDKLESLRRAQDGCFDLSFPTIAGYMSNGAIIHYEPTSESDTEIKPDGILLVDSGGQYYDGTTDITRTIAVGPLSDKIRKCYTLVLRGHIDLAMAKFPCGTTGKELDEITRKPLQSDGLDYNHGTGHGVGHVLSVHEGPNYISKRDGGQEMLPGMITSDEPGVYIEGEFGIRIESEILCVKTGENELGFKDITLAPLERDAIIPDLLTKEELSWLNEYHERVYSSLKQYLTPEEAAWLRDVTAPL